MKVPEIRRRICGSGLSTTLVIVYFGALPSTLPSARLLSPSWANASLRIFSMRAVSPRSDAIVKSHASVRLPLAMPARLSVLKMPL